MRRHVPVGVIVALVAGALAPAQALAENGAFAGNVSGPGYSGENVEVFAFSPGSGERVGGALPGYNGNYSAVVSPGSYNACAVPFSLTGYFLQQCQGVGVAAGKTTFGVNFVLTKGGIVQGAVTDASSGKIVIGAKVTVVGAPPQACGGPPYSDTCSAGGESGINGAYATSVLAAGAQTLQFSDPPTYETQNVGTTVSVEGKTVLNVTLKLAGSGGPGSGGPGSGGGGATGHVTSSGGSTVNASGGEATVTLNCVGEGPCTVEVTLTSSHSGHAAARHKARPIVVGHAKVTIAAGAVQRVRIKLTKAAKSLLRTHHGHIGALLTISGMAGKAPVHLVSAVVLKLSRRR